MTVPRESKGDQLTDLAIYLRSTSLIRCPGQYVLQNNSLERLPNVGECILLSPFWPEAFSKQFGPRQVFSIRN